MNRYLKYIFGLIALALIVLAVYFMIVKSDNHTGSSHEKNVYTCSMHPEIIQDKPGNCPICGMTLVQKVNENQDIDTASIENVLKPTDNFIVGNFQTTTPSDTIIRSEINLPGLVAFDPNAAVNIATRISGRIEKMYVNYKYQRVNKGQKLFDLYSPELLTEQQNFIYLITNDAQNSSIIKAAKQKLLLYGLTLNQVNALASSRRANPVVSIYSPANGIVQGMENMENSITVSMENDNASTENLTVKEGDYIKKNEVVFKLVNTDKVWGIFNVLQGYNSLVKTNQSIRISTELDENEFIDAKVNFIETQFNQADKSNRIRVYLNNNSLKLPIGLRLQGIIETNPTQGIWLEKKAMVSIGNKKIVFLKMNNGFKVKEIKIGIESNGFVQIIDGISVKDTIAKNAQYLIDSESFIKTE